MGGQITTRKTLHILLLSSAIVLTTGCAPMRLTQAPAPRVSPLGSLALLKYESEVNTLLLLSDERASKQSDTTPDPRSIAARCVMQVEQARSYSSFVRILNKNMKELAANNYVLAAIRFDHVDPDRDHVVQTAWNGHAYDYDEWITIGNTGFELALLALGPLSPESPLLKDRLDVGRRAGFQKYAKVLQSKEPSSVGTHSYAGKRYTLLTYVGDFELFFVRSPGSAQLELWIDSASGLLAKARLVFAAPSGGAPAQFEYEQVFVGYSGDIRVEAPPVVRTTK
jgi:hypothetical protein